MVKKQGNPIFAKRLKEMRGERGLSQEELGKLVGLSSAIICKYELGLTTAGIENTKAIADALGIGFNYLVGWSDQRYKIDAEQLADLYVQLPDEGKKQVFDFAEYLHKKEGEK